MADPPGKVLSSLTPSSSSDKQQSKIGGCAGVFFQLFDWNKRLHGKRLFPHKLLPAERKQVSKPHKDEKLPMAKLLLIADENRGGFPRPSQSDGPDGLLKERTPEKKKSGKRAPGVVARLMGLETMPSPEPPRRERQDFEHDKHPPMGKYGEQPYLPVEKGKYTKQKPIDKCPSARQSLSKDINSSFRKENEFQADEKHSGTLTRHCSNRVEDLKPMFFYKLPALSPRQSDCALRSILSPSKSHNKLVSPIKSPLASKSAARLFEAAAKILEPSMQPSTRGRNLGTVVRPLLVGDGDGEAKGNKKGCRTLSCPKKKPQAVKKQALPSPPVSDQQAKSQVRSKQENKPINTGDSNAAQSKLHVTAGKKAPPSSSQEASKCIGGTKEDSATPGQRLLRSRSVKEEVGGVKPNRAQQEPRVCREEKSKPDLRRQEQSCKRLSQPTAKSQSLKKAGTKQERDPSTSGALQLECTENGVKRLASNNASSKTMSSSSVVTSASSNSLTSSSGILNYGRLFSSRKAVSTNDSNKRMMESSQKKGDSSLMKSLLKRKASTAENTTSIARQSVKLKHENSQATLEPICQTECSEVMQNTNESLPDESLTEGGCSNENVAADSSLEGGSGKYIEQDSNCIVESLDVSAESIVECRQYGGEQVLNSWAPHDTHSLETTFKSSDISNVESSCDSCADGQGEREDGADSASSYVYPDSGVYRRKEPVSYSGKTTAAILQELLMALNSSRPHASLDGLPQEKPELLKFTGNSLQHPEIDALVACSNSMESALSHTSDGSASSTGTTDNSMQETNMVSRASKCRYQSSFEDCVGTRLQPSPVSTLQCPFQDESSDSFESLQDQKSPCCETSDCMSTIVGQSRISDDVDSYDEAFADRNKLLDTISRIHHIDISSIGARQAMESEEGYIRVIVGAAKLSAEDVYSARLHLSGPLINPAFFKNIEEQNRQWEWGIFPEDDDLSSCRSEIDLSFTRSQFEEAAVQNRKLVFDCINEALSLNMGIGEESSQNYFLPILISPAAHLSKLLHRNLNDWRDMACSMNIDDLVEKEMNTGLGRWTDFNSEISEIAMELEGHILRGLIEEVVVDLGANRRNPIPNGGYQSTLHLSRFLVK